MGLRQSILNERVSDLDLRPIITINPNRTVRQAVEKMRRKHLGLVVVVDKNKGMVGQFTERMLIKLLLNSPAGLDAPVKNHMCSEGAAVRLTDSIAKVIECMEAKKQRFVLVLDDHGQPVGLTGQKTVMEYIADYFPRQVKVQDTGERLFMDQREGA